MHYTMADALIEINLFISSFKSENVKSWGTLSDDFEIFVWVRYERSIVHFPLIPSYTIGTSMISIEIEFKLIFFFTQIALCFFCIDRRCTTA